MITKRHAAGIIRGRKGDNKMTTISKWAQGVNEYKAELLEAYDEAKAHDASLELTEAALLNGAADWKAYSWGGTSLIYDADIAERLATPSEIKRRTLKDGLSSWASPTEQWLDVQARALYQAAQQIINEAKEA